MSKTRTILTAVAEEVTNPTAYKMCPACKVELPVKLFKDGFTQVCKLCRIERGMPTRALDTNFSVPAGPGEQKCMVCGRNFKYHQHNFDYRYKHPSGKEPCCKYCQVRRTRAVFKVEMDLRNEDKAELNAITAAVKAGNVKEAKRLEKEYQERKKGIELEELYAETEEADERWRKKYAALGQTIDRHGNTIDSEGNVVLQPGQTEPYSIQNPKPDDGNETTDQNV